MVILAIVVWFACIVWLFFPNAYRGTILEPTWDTTTSYEPTKFICDRYKPNDKMTALESLDASLEYKKCLLRELERFDD